MATITCIQCTCLLRRGVGLYESVSGGSNNYCNIHLLNKDTGQCATDTVTPGAQGKLPLGNLFEAVSIELESDPQSGT